MIFEVFKFIDVDGNEVGFEECSLVLGSLEVCDRHNTRTGTFDGMGYPMPKREFAEKPSIGDRVELVAPALNCGHDGKWVKK